ncbi:hypothetical protein C8Q75DRAFT_746819 [Abortiporus biennis]|nr:hypothetical protein C8Q75DRAFT_746819 [Abortiporus biennis]
MSKRTTLLVRSNFKLYLMVVFFPDTIWSTNLKWPGHSHHPEIPIQRATLPSHQQVGLSETFHWYHYVPMGI